MVVTTPETRQAPWALCKLPAFPPIATRLLHVLSREDAVFREIVHLVSSDTALAAEVLRLVNSSLFGLRSKVSNLQHAVALLGMARVRSLAVAVAIMKDYLKGTLKESTLRKCWKHTVACAVLAEELSIAATLDPDDAYTAGLIHDIGRLGLLVSYPSEYANLIHIAEQHHFDPRDCERQLFDIDHCEAGRWLTAEWKFSDELQQVAGCHHDKPPEGPLMRIDMVTLVHFSCELADAMGFGIACQTPDNTPPDGVFDAAVAMLPPGLERRIHSDKQAFQERVMKKIEAMGGAA